ncbi:aspartate dehydrogenase domain-containing protein [Paenibacillus chungangensis]|uniref:L-aspartate dehydrogenase n=1 Tax=Paenibacillus chungangensis TaxID=696535 RepID=A0ABW3HR08_9BACL
MMKKTRLALLGCGRLNEIVAHALEEHLPEYELVGVMGRSSERTQIFAERYGGKACTDIEELMALKPDFIAEAASPQAVKDYAETILKGGANLVVLTVGAFADADFFNRVKETAREHNQRVYIASGAVGGFDVLRTAALMSPIKATMTSKKSLRSLSYTPLFSEELMSITEPKQVFSGNTKEAIEMLPFHFNVAVATALASAGPEQTTLNIDAVPHFTGDEYKIEIQGEEVHTDLNIYSRTPRIAAWSMVAVLRNAVSPIVF